MRELNLKNLIDLNDKIKDIEVDIADIRESMCSPKSPSLTGMPRGNGWNGSSLVNSLDKINRLEHKKAFFYDKLVSEWLICESMLKSCDINEKQLEIIRYRYFYALSWRSCLKAVATIFPCENWNENKIYRLHRQVMAKCIKNDIKVC